MPFHQPFCRPLIAFCIYLAPQNLPCRSNIKHAFLIASITARMPITSSSGPKNLVTLCFIILSVLCSGHTSRLFLSLLGFTGSKLYLLLRTQAGDVIHLVGPPSVIRQYNPRPLLISVRPLIVIDWRLSP